MTNAELPGLNGPDDPAQESPEPISDIPRVPSKPRRKSLPRRHWDKIQEQKKTITDLENKYEKSEYKNSHDAMTGLKTKEAWYAKIDELREAGVEFGVILVDMNKFKDVNDEVGHIPADEIVKDYSKKIAESYSERLKAKFRRKDDVTTLGQLVEKEEEPGEDMLSRWGGDEWGIIVVLTENVEYGRIGTIEERMIKEMDHLDLVNNDFVKNDVDEVVRNKGFGFAAGYSIYDPTYPIDTLQLVHNADRVMHANKLAQNAGR